MTSSTSSRGHLRAVIRATGAYLPGNGVTNAMLAERVETSDSWITERTGIRQRYFAAAHEITSDLGAAAARDALNRAELAASDIDLVLLATTTPDDTMPATATKIQHKIGMKTGAAFDINAACSGFVFALVTADSFIRSGQAKRVLVIGAETYSRILNWSDRSTCVLFGDGAGAVILEAQSDTERGILFGKLYSDGQHHALLNTTGGVSSTQQAGMLTMQGKEVFRHAVAKMSEVVMEGLGALGLQPGALDWLVPHQANIRILHAVAKQLGLSAEKCVTSVAHHANTSAASIPLALHMQAQAGKLKPGQLLALPALGAGLTWGVSLLRW